MLAHRFGGRAPTLCERGRAPGPVAPWHPGGAASDPGRRIRGTRVRSLAGTLDLPGLADVVGRARLLVCGDTGVAHLATALGTPSVLLFGPVSPARWGPAVDPHLHTVLWHGDGAGDPHGPEVDPALAAVTALEADQHRRGVGRRPAGPGHRVPPTASAFVPGSLRRVSNSLCPLGHFGIVSPCVTWTFSSHVAQ